MVGVWVGFLGKLPSSLQILAGCKDVLREKNKSVAAEGK